MAGSGRYRTLAAKLAVLCVTCLGLALLLEGMLRAFYPMDTEYVRFHPHLRYEKIPNWKAWYTNPQVFQRDFLAERSFNSLGLQDHEFALDELKDRFVILALGDSLTMGTGVPLEDAWPKVLERRLDDPAIRVVNAGTGSYALDSYLSFIKYEADKFSPDVVLVGLFAGNDVTPQTLYEEVDGALVEQPVPEWSALTKVQWFFERRSHLYKFLTFVVHGTSIGDGLRRAGLLRERDMALHRDPETFGRWLGKSKRIAREIARESERRGYQAVFVLVPFREQVDDAKFERAYGGARPNRIGRYQVQNAFAELFEEESIAFIDPLPRFRSLNQDNSFYYEHDGHMNRDGYGLLADVVFEWLREHGVGDAGGRRKTRRPAAGVSAGG